MAEEVTLSQAIGMAEKQANVREINAVFEANNGKVVYEIEIVKKRRYSNRTRPSR